MKLAVIEGKIHLEVKGVFSSQQVLEMIHRINDARAQIAEDPRSPVGIPLKMTAGPAWHTDYNVLVPAHVLCFLNGLGWQSFALSTPDASKLVGFLSSQIANVLGTVPAEGSRAGPITASDPDHLH